MVIIHVPTKRTHKLSVARVNELVEKTVELDLVKQAVKLGDTALVIEENVPFTGRTSGTPATLISHHFTMMFSVISGADIDS
ncbi:hypothetical protein [Brevibacillus dissolubilis]|uniref:hypothetical protein n=1 Tax=Brevibacillus dissolubilis TaxID=1844116 RepID=UPI0011172BA8|nr:hypothetical protein [Brevibacillus dissolubilis]